MPIPFTQYLRPDGRMKEVTIDRPPDVERVALSMIELGCVFEIEMLASGEISMTCELDDEVLAIEVVPNGPDVPAAVDRMVLSVARGTTR